MKKFNIKKGGNNVLWTLFRSGDCYYSICFGFIDIMVDTPVILMLKNFTSRKEEVMFCGFCLGAATVIIAAAAAYRIEFILTEEKKLKNRKEE